MGNNQVQKFGLCLVSWKSLKVLRNECIDKIWPIIKIILKFVYRMH